MEKSDSNGLVEDWTTTKVERERERERERKRESICFAANCLTKNNDGQEEFVAFQRANLLTFQATQQSVSCWLVRASTSDTHTLASELVWFGLVSKRRERKTKVSISFA